MLNKSLRKCFNLHANFSEMYNIMYTCFKWYIWLWNMIFVQPLVCLLQIERKWNTALENYTYLFFTTCKIDIAACLQTLLELPMWIPVYRVIHSLKSTCEVHKQSDDEQFSKVECIIAALRLLESQSQNSW